MTRKSLARFVFVGAVVIGSLALWLAMQAPVQGASGRAVAATPVWGADIRADSITSGTLPLAENFAMAVNPANPNEVIAGFDSWNNAPSNSMYAHSTDAGRTWQGDWFYGPWFGDGEPNGNISVTADPQGILYYASSYVANGGPGYAVLTSTQGSPWSDPVPIVVGGPGDYYDQGSLVADTSPISPHQGTLYFIMRYFTNDYNGVLLRYSTDQGRTWSANIPVSDARHNDAFGPTLAIAADGTLYAGFAYIKSAYLANNPEFYLDRSTDGGLTWSGDNMVAGGPVTKVGAMDAELHELMLLGNGNEQGVHIYTLPILAVAPNDPHTLYLVWNDGRWEQGFTFFNHPGQHSDIAFSRSTDGGTTWTAPLRVNDDPEHNGIDQFLPAIATRPDGTIGLTWYDRRLDPDHYLYDLFYTQSTDGGATWSADERVSDRSSDPLAVPNGELNGDVGLYTALVFGPDYVLPSWVDTRDGRAKEFYTDRGVLPLVTATPLPSATPTVPPSPVASATPSPIASATPSPIASATPSPAPSATTPAPPTATPCAIQFADVHPTDYFAQPVLYLACHGVISGYADGTFRPFNNTTRGQTVKIVVLGLQMPVVTPAGGTYTFADVPPSQPFFAPIETAAAGGILNGYACGGAGEPCDALHRPYFRPAANVTRGQLSKIVVNAKGWGPLTPPTPTFADVPAASPFYGFVEQAVAHSVLSGYACGGAGEPCPGRYFRPGNPSTRGQLSKILYNAIVAP